MILRQRKLADELNLEFTGTVGVLILAKQNGIIPLLLSYFEKIRKTNFRISESFLKVLLEKYDS
jgi:predicted nucleic acid-binding protein